MRKKRRILARYVTGLLIGLLAVMLTLVLSLGHVLRKVIAVAGQQILDVDVRLHKADVALLRGDIHLQGLQIDNPPGYQHATFLQLENAHIKIVPTSIARDEIVIKHIQLKDIDVVVEQNRETSNIREITDRLPKPYDKDQPRGRRLRVDELEITSVRVHVKLLPLPGRQDTLQFDLPPIRLTELGYDYYMDAGLLTGKILIALTERILSQGFMDNDSWKKALNKTLQLGEQIMDANALGGKLRKGISDIFQPPPDAPP
ncbi:hypothetical protein ACFL6U_16345 [Planctomycetota bacterium]